MARITVCDMCKSQYGKLTEVNRYLKVKGHKDLRLDLCGTHMLAVQKQFPKVTPEFVQFVYRMTRGVEVRRETALELLRR